jgi:IS605 OrfB family transposase
VKTIQAYRFVLDLAPAQERRVLAHAGAARVAYNWSLARVKAVMEQRGAERTYGLTDEQLTPSVSWSLPALRRTWNSAKAEVAPWWPECSKEAFNTGLAQPASTVGVDVGIKHLAILSTGELVPNPRQLAKAQARLRALNRSLSRKTGSDWRIWQQPSKRWLRASLRLHRAHARVANLRRNGLHKITTRPAREHGTVVVEDLNVTGMLADRKLARHIADTGFAEIRRQLAYKTEWNGGRLLVADRWYPSSKTCSGCGAAKAKLALSEREYRCDACGVVLDRDLNAARNLAALAAEFDTAGSGPVAGRGADPEDSRTRAGGQETSTRHRIRGSDRDRRTERRGYQLCAQ